MNAPDDPFDCPAAGHPVGQDLPAAAREPAGAGPEVQALAGVSFTLQPASSLGVVGESGSGKSTLARLVMALEAPTAGQVLPDGRGPAHAWTPAELRRARAGFQMVFQDPYGSLDPRRTVLQTVAEPLAVLHGASAAEQRERAAEALDAVGLRAATWPSTRTSSPAASASASPSPAR
jgi:peptide/nickel transport system ATP-binding protein